MVWNFILQERSFTGWFEMLKEISIMGGLKYYITGTNVWDNKIPRLHRA